MHTHLFFFFFIIIIIFILLPTSFCAHNEQYLNCSEPFQCANIPNISYPFWGQNRPDYCGHPGFQLDCQGDAPEITIHSIPYRVFGINSSAQTLALARDDFWSTNCPTHLVNTTMDNNLFNYTSTSQDMYLYYGCDSDQGLSPNLFNCNINGTRGLVGTYMKTTNVTVMERTCNSIVKVGKSLVANTTTCNAGIIWSNTTNNVVTCKSTIVVPVFQSAAQVIERSQTSTSLEEAFKGGFGLVWEANDKLCSQCVGSGGQCGYNTNSSEFTCYCKDQPYASSCPPNRLPSGINFPKKIAGSSSGINIPKKIAIGISAGVAGIIIVFVVMISILKGDRLSGKAMIVWKKETKDEQKVKAFIRSYGSLAPNQYKFSDVKKMTKSFADKLGQGGYGSVYKGTLSDGHLVAVKVLTESKGNGEEFINEVASITRTSHVNIVTLLGFCYERTKRALIYEFMPNGSLDKFIYDERSSNTNRQLEWKTLYQIAVGIARGLEYLHRGCKTRILHFDIKPHNILLDEDFCPKISDFGLAKLCPRKESIMSMQGTRGTAGYIAPELFSRNFGGVSHKSDVYSYGMMVLEMVGGRRNIDVGGSRTSEIYFPHWIHKNLELGEGLKLHGVMTEEEEEIARKMILVGLWCIQTNPSDRPSISRAVEMLEGSLQSLQIPPKPYLSSPTRPPPQHSSATSSS